MTFFPVVESRLYWYLMRLYWYLMRVSPFRLTCTLPSYKSLENNWWPFHIRSFLSFGIRHIPPDRFCRFFLLVPRMLGLRSRSLVELWSRSLMALWSCLRTLVFHLQVNALFIKVLLSSMILNCATIPWLNPFAWLHKKRKKCLFLTRKMY